MRTHNLLAVAGLGLLVSFTLAGCGAQEEAQAAVSKPALTVEVVTPKQESWPRPLAASGPVAAWQEASVGTELTGVRLEEVLVNVGDVVSRGQLLARYSEDSLQADLARLDAQVAEARAALEKARLDAESADRLESSGALSRQEIRAVRTQASVAEARLASAQAQREAQALRLRYARVTAPDDGVISARAATVGAVATAGNSELFRLIRRGRLEWRAEVRADALPQLKRGTRASVRLQDGSVLEGTVRQIAPSVAADTLNGVVYVDLPARSGLAAGMFVSGEFELPATPALSLPESALVFRNGNRYVMQVDEASRIHERKVQVGRRRGTDVEIVEGLAPDARVALSGGAFLNDGDRVAIAGARAP
jgi:RND family efflux transporter MFP subunit